jgi:DNA-binding transcriptional LysR family regulator
MSVRNGGFRTSGRARQFLRRCSGTADQPTNQPTISKILRALETELDGKLIARSTRQLSLTDEGLRYYNECRQILAAVDAAEHSFQSGREAVAGPLRVGSSVSFGRLQIADCRTVAGLP